MKKRFKIITFLISAVFLLVPFRAFAAGFGWFSEGVAWLIRAIGYLINAIAGLFLTLAASLSDFALQLNITYLDSAHLRGEGSLVKVGWELSRDIANLGFVLAIIIIAFATIIQYKQYGAKKLLPKLIAAAIIINFSMAIVTPVIVFSNTITKFFLAGQLGASYGENVNLSQIIADSFGPQKLIMGRTGGEGPEPPSTGEDPGAFSGFGKALTLAAASALFSVVFTTIATITFFALAFMLIVRYVFLSFLLILAPIAWLVWVIPGLENLFSKWWSHFFKWSFFAPAMSLFIYLALVGGKMLEGGAGANTVKSSFSGNLQNIMSQGAEMVILAGLLIGGLIVAQNMGIYGAKGAIGIAKRASSQGQKWAARKGRQWSSAPIRGKYGKQQKSLAERTQAWASQGGVKGLVGRAFVKPAANISTAGGEKVIKEHDAAVKDLSSAQTKAALATTISVPRKVALLKKLANEGQLKGDDVKKYITKTTRDRFARFGQGSEFSKIIKKAGITPEMNMALKENKKDSLRESSRKHIQGLSKKDVQDIPWSGVFKALQQGKGALGFDNKKLDELAGNLASSLATENPSLVFSIIPTLDSQALESFENKYKSALDEELGRATEGSDLSEKLKATKKGFEKSIAKRAFGGEVKTEEAG